jgi:ABC-type transport system involved in multi-copper enzyme maturation permease subunit
MSASLGAVVLASWLAFFLGLAYLALAKRDA